MNRTRDMGYNGGYDIRDAKVWQRRVLFVDEQVNLAEVLPGEIGAAAAYEAYRMWKHHRGLLFEPLGGATEREREALIGLATAEATRLWAYSGRAMDTYGQRDCLESAALTASRIAASMMYSQGLGGYGSSGYGYGDTYRGRRYSNASQPIVIQAPNTGYPGSAPMPIPGSGIGAGIGSVGSGIGGVGGGMGGGFGAGYPGSSPYSGSISGSPYAPAGVPAYADSAARGYPGSYGSAGGGFVAPSLSSRRSPSPFMQPAGLAGTSPYMGAAQPYSSSYGGTYGQPGYGQSQPGGVYTVSASGTTSIPAPPGSTIIISTKGRSRRDSSGGRHHHHHHGLGGGIRRARSADLGYRI
ncbi:hypothetical protein EIP86_003399 [Pleurotus ostreatoroseus]|nr:hypothetical protein EIP86_003399 [Pleurotus ostreatoroseus]